MYITRARLTACEVGVFLRYITTLENTPTPLFEEPHKFITLGYIFDIPLCKCKSFSPSEGDCYDSGGGSRPMSRNSGGGSRPMSRNSREGSRPMSVVSSRDGRETPLRHTPSSEEGRSETAAVSSPISLPPACSQPSVQLVLLSPYPLHAASPQF